MKEEGGRDQKDFAYMYPRRNGLKNGPTALRTLSILDDELRGQ
jgi:hypothetical protein